MPQDLTPGDYLIFQLEAGYALLRLLAVEEDAWHVAAYNEFFPSVEAAETAINAQELHVSDPHIALTMRAFESTQVAKIAHAPLTADDLAGLRAWAAAPERNVSDRSIRLMLGLR